MRTSLCQCPEEPAVRVGHVRNRNQLHRARTRDIRPVRPGGEVGRGLDSAGAARLAGKFEEQLAGLTSNAKSRWLRHAGGDNADADDVSHGIALRICDGEGEAAQAVGGCVGNEMCGGAAEEGD